MDSSTQSPAPARQYWIDIMRTFACICVITLHSPLSEELGGEPLAPACFFYLRSGASVLFFMISGALIFDKPRRLIPFMKTRLLHIGVPAVIWELLALARNIYIHDYTSTGIVIGTLTMPFIDVARNEYWFIYTLMGIYLITPMLSTWLNSCSRRECEILLGLWGLTLCIPYAAILLPQLNKASELNGMLYYFTGYAGYAVLGFYLRRHVSITKITPAMVIAVLLIITVTWLLSEYVPSVHTVLLSRTNICTALMAATYFLLIKSISVPERTGKIFYNFANHSFGIYLVHYLVISELLWPVTIRLGLQPAVSIPATAIFTIIISYVAVSVMSHLPLSRYTVSHTAPARTLRLRLSLK